MIGDIDFNDLVEKIAVDIEEDAKADIDNLTVKSITIFETRMLIVATVIFSEDTMIVPEKAYAILYNIVEGNILWSKAISGR